MPVIVKSNRHVTSFFHGSDVPEKILRDQFDWVDDPLDSGAFMRRHGEWFHLGEFTRLSPGSAFGADWGGIAPSSAFSGMVVQLTDKGYRIGYYYHVYDAPSKVPRGSKVYSD